jgi:small subunit ribosomal protein S4
MGDPKKHRKKYIKPSHPWQRARIDEEKIIVQEYGFKNKKEIWRMNALLRNVTAQSKKLVTLSGAQAEKEKEALLNKMKRYGLIPADGTLDSLLAINLRHVLERRLQTIVFRKHLANSSKQARQFIVHGHIKVAGKKVTAPSYLVPLNEEASIDFVAKSSLADTEHPERVAAKKSKELRENPVVSEGKTPRQQDAGRRPIGDRRDSDKKETARPKKEPKKESKKEVKKE